MMKNRNNPYKACDWDGPSIGILWDQSLVWGLLCTRTLTLLGVPFRLISASEAASGCLDAFRILLVPGGWAAHKLRALGESGRREIARFIEEGGTYIGFCGGAGLALSSPPALYLTPVERMPLAERLPSASGQVLVSGDPSHPAWKDIPSEIPVSVWWPSQFEWRADCAVTPVASYTAPGADFQVADLRVSDLDANASWQELEKAYKINLDPARIKGHPAIIEVPKGKGRLVLSYAHLETPGDEWGNRLLVNILSYLDGESASSGRKHGEHSACAASEFPDEKTWSCLSRAGEAASELIDFGEANLLWNWRKPWLLNWRRGIRGLECGTLAVTIREMAELRDRFKSGKGPAGRWPQRAAKLEETVVEFCALAKRLLLEEKIASQTAILSKLGKVNDRVDDLRGTLFGNRMNHGGLCRALFDQVDVMLLDLMRLGEVNSEL